MKRPDYELLRRYYDTLDLKAKKQRRLRQCKFFGLYITPIAAILFMTGYWVVGISNYFKE